MEKNKFFALAEENLKALKAIPFPGDGIIVGMDEHGKNFVQICWLMGRKFEDREQLYIAEEGGLVISVPTDPNKIGGLNSAIFIAMDQSYSNFVVSNGRQTKTALGCNSGYDLGITLRHWKYKEDFPNYTPRITAILSLDSENALSAQMSIIKKSPSYEICDRYLYSLPLSPDTGYCLTTSSDSNYSLRSYHSNPFLLPLVGDIERISHTIWNSLSKEHRVALAVKIIGISGNETWLKIINRHEAIK